MSKLLHYPVTIKVTTGLDGTGALSVRVPGTFNGVVDTCNGRFLRYVDLIPDGGIVGDRITNMRIEDSDGILQGIGKAGNFPMYPVLYYFEDIDIVETPEMKRGISIPPSGFRFEKFDDGEKFNFIPSGMYVKGTLVSAAAAVGQNIFVNIGWGKVV